MKLEWKVVIYLITGVKGKIRNKKRGIIMEGLAFIWILFVYIGLPVAVVLLLIWIYKIKSNSETQVKQNQKIIQLLDERYK